MRLITYLYFDGKCEEAFDFYATLLGGKIEGIYRWEGTPAAEHVPEESRNLIMHESLAIGDQTLMGADLPANRFQKPQGFAVSLNLNDAEKAKVIFNGLSEGGTVQMPLEKTFWAVLFGMVVDRFGTPWMINCE